MTFQVEPLTRDELDEILRDYVCSTCWGPLRFKYIEGGVSGKSWLALCANCQYDTTGYTSKHFAEHKRVESESELVEATHNLRDVLGLRPERQSAKKNISDLGF